MRNAVRAADGLTDDETVTILHEAETRRMICRSVRTPGGFQSVLKLNQRIFFISNNIVVDIFMPLSPKFIFLENFYQCTDSGRRKKNSQNAVSFVSVTRIVIAKIIQR